MCKNPKVEDFKQRKKKNEKTKKNFQLDLCVMWIILFEIQQLHWR